jgi:hypothetical protein
MSYNNENFKMKNWTDKLKQLVLPGSEKCIIIADVDSLFIYEELRQLISAEGYRIIDAKESLDVRIEFELNARGSDSNILIVAPPSYRPQPDIAAEVYFRNIGLKDLYPNLDASAIKGLSFNALSMIFKLKPYEVLGYDKTIRYLIESLYGADLNSLHSGRSREEALSLLITVLTEDNGINLPIKRFLANIIKPHYPGLNEEKMNLVSILEFLQEKWNDFIATRQSEINFEDSSLIKIFGYLFLNGSLSAVKDDFEKYNSFPEKLKFGIQADSGLSREKELERLTQYFEERISSLEDNYNEWFNNIQILAKARLQEFDIENEELANKYFSIEKKLNERFQRFIDNTYSSLFSLTGVRRPIVISRVLEFLKAHNSRKKVLLVIDGINFWQYMMVENALLEAGISVKRNATLAYIPSITAWSRQALFKGNKPDLSKDNSNEAEDFAAFWKNNGYMEYQIWYFKAGVNIRTDVESVSTNKDILGIVYNDLDDIMHGSVLGNEQLKSSTEQWIEQSGVIDMISRLKELGYSVFITTDHGNVEAKGIKNLRTTDKAGSLSRGKRYIYFDNETMKANFLEMNNAINCGTRGNAVFLRGEEAFINENVKIITHGGSHIWEVVIPFAEVI